MFGSTWRFSPVFRGRLIFIDPDFVQIFSLSSCLAVALSGGLVPDVVIFLITKCCSNGDYMAGHTMAPSMNAKVGNLQV